jgi:hypothetical protein
MACKLTQKQSWTLTVLARQCLVYGATKLRLLILQYEYNNRHQVTGLLRKEHEMMIKYFKELFEATVNNQLTK